MFFWEIWQNRKIKISFPAYQRSMNAYELLRYGVPTQAADGEKHETVELINWDEPGENQFLIAEEVTIKANQKKRPDLVIYINGIAVAVIELKKSAVSVAEGIRQNLTNQREEMIQPFFSTIQFCMAGSPSEGLRYGTLITDAVHYTEWKSDGFTDAKHEDERDKTDIKIESDLKEERNKLFRQLYQMFYKARFLDLIRYFTVYDKGRKKVCRYNQYYGIKRAQNRLAKKEGGIIWHTQGSGKSLTMVWLAKWILENNSKARVLIVTDRDELDEQIEKTFLGVNEKKIRRTKSGRDLINRLNQHTDRLICSLIHKFGRRGGEVTDKDYDRYIDDLKKNLPPNFKVKDEMYIFVDECHRTQSGKLHRAMKEIIPDGIMIGFTGTPLLKDDKTISIRTFGSYIHTYKFDEGVRDGVVLDLLYEARSVPQEIRSKEAIDRWFECNTRGLTERAKAKLKQRWGNLEKVYSSRSRLDSIAVDIITDFHTKSRLANGTGTAMLVADSVYNACKYYQAFKSRTNLKCAVITSYEPQVSKLRTDTVSFESETEEAFKYHTYLDMIGIDPTKEDARQIKKRVETFEAKAKRLFVDEPANMRLLIVVDKLLTGFDAPSCTYLYIDKKMHDHGLFQAICRVNRLDGEDKPFGYIVDYMNLFGDVNDAMNAYTSGAFEGYVKEDVEGLIKDSIQESKQHFEAVLDALEELCEGVAYPKELDDYIYYFVDQGKDSGAADELLVRIREKLYRLVNSLIQAYADLKPHMKTVGYSASQQEYYSKKVKFYTELKEAISLRSADYIDLKAYDPGMRFLIDNYISASLAERIGEMDDYTLLDYIEAERKNSSGDKGTSSGHANAAETIENNIRKKIVERITVNPLYYNKLSAILNDLIEQRKRGVLIYKELLKRYKELVEAVENPEKSESYPENIRGSKALCALYDHLNHNSDLAIQIHETVLAIKPDRFRGNMKKENVIKKALFRILQSFDDVERIFEIITAQEEY